MTPAQLTALLSLSLTVQSGQVILLNEAALQPHIDTLVYQAVFGDSNTRQLARWLIWEIAQTVGIYPSSIHPLYMAISRQLFPARFTVPAMNFRGLVYDTARALFSTAVATNTKAFIAELARGEMAYSDQSPAEYTTCLLAAAIREGYRGPVFIQGDHFQTKCSSRPGIPVSSEIDSLVAIIKSALAAGFYNIDVDTSTLVDITKSKVADQQAPNVHYSAELIKLIRSLEPAGLTISIGGEIGHIGGKNSTVADCIAYMDGLIATCPDLALISKISVATGTSHGGVIRPDGSLSPVNVDFSILKELTALGRKTYHLAGTVQHGASTLPDEWLSRFPDSDAVEIHLATGFQNTIFDHPEFPASLTQEMYAWLNETQTAEKEPGWTAAQFQLKLRKKCWGHFKRQIWNLPESTRAHFRDSLAKRFTTIFNALQVTGTADLVNEYIPMYQVHKTVREFVSTAPISSVSGLSD